MGNSFSMDCTSLKSHAIVGKLLHVRVGWGVLSLIWEYTQVKANKK